MYVNCNVFRSSSETQGTVGTDYSWHGQLAWTVGMTSWHGQLAWTVGMDSWHGQLAWTTVGMASWHGQLA